MIKRVEKNKVRKVRHMRSRNHISGTSERPRLNVYRSLNHIYVQLIDDVAGHTLVSASSLDVADKGTKADIAKIVGQNAGKAALDKGIKKVVFDRSGYIYTGRVAKVADGAREAGLEF